MESDHPDLLKYYENRRTGKIEEKSFEEWGEPLCEERAKMFYSMETGTVRQAFFEMDYSHGFTGRGGKFIACARDVWYDAYEGLVLRGTLERPGLVGPRNETPEESVDPFGGSRDEQIDRPLWIIADGGKSMPSEESNGDEGAGPMGESRDEEEVAPYGEVRDRDDGLHQVHREEGGEVDGEGEAASPEGMNALMQLAAQSVDVVSNVFTNTGDASSSHTATTLPTEPLATVTSSSPPLASVPSTPTRKRARDSEDNLDDEESSLQQKRMRMDDALGIVRNDADGAKAPQNVVSVAKTDTQQSKKRARSLDDDDSEEGVSEPTEKRVRLHEQSKEISDEEEEYITANAANDGHSTPACQEKSTHEAQEAAMVDKTPTNAKAEKQPFVEDEAPTNDETAEREDASANGEAAAAEVVWDTAHGINSSCANIEIPRRTVRDVTGQVGPFCLPTSTGSPDRPWTEGEKEDLRVYIQDYGIGSWTVLSRSTNRPKEDLQRTYLEVIKARNIQAGRPERAGTTDRYPNLAPPPPPVTSEPPPPPEEPMKLRALDQIGKKKEDKFGDLKYDMKATSFPKITQDGGMIDSKGNVLLGVMGDIPRATKPRQPKLKLRMPKNLPLAEHSKESESPQVKIEEMDSDIEEGEIVESEKQAGEQAPCPKDMGKKKGPLSASGMEEEDREIKQEDSDLEQQVSIWTIPESKKDTARGPLGPRFAGVAKLCGSSRRGVPRKAEGSRRYSAK